MSTKMDLNQVGGDEWVNCAITWIKSADGTLERWIQPKLHPAWEERDIVHQHMFKGRSIYMFKGQLENDAHVLFGTLVCFDWIVAHRRIADPFNGSSLKYRKGQVTASFLSHGSSLFSETLNHLITHFSKVSKSFYNQNEYPNVDRHNACIVFANTAGKPIPSRVNRFGASSIVLSPQTLFMDPTCQPTFSKGGPKIPRW